MHDDLIDALGHAPALMVDLTDTMSADAMRSSPAVGEWSVADIIGHIRAADAIWRTRVLLALVHDGISAPDVDERALQSVLESSGLGLAIQVTSFALGRSELVGILRALSDDEWTRTCRHATAGAMSVFDACAALEAHELEHLEQLRRAAAQ